MSLTAEPVADGATVDRVPPRVIHAARGVAVRDLAGWRDSSPRVTSTDPRLGLAVDQALADLAALQIRDVAHPDRVVVAAGAPWFMTLFGRDSLLTAWMSLPFDALLAPGVLLTLAELRGRRDDPVAEEEPGKILHELRRRGGSGPFSARQRYYGSVDATPLFVMVVGEAWRWGALDLDTLDQLRPAVEAAVGWIEASTNDGFVTYQRRGEQGLANQGWKDSWDGITFADGTPPTPPIAFVEVQGYAYAALHAAADIADATSGTLDATALRQQAEELKDRFNATFWDDRGWFALGRDGHGRLIDALTTNPGHALWCGLASEDHARVYLDRLGETDLWSGWGLRTLATTMGAYDPLSYHNGSVWPHDTAICAGGRGARWPMGRRRPNRRGVPRCGYPLRRPATRAVLRSRPRRPAGPRFVPGVVLAPGVVFGLHPAPGPPHARTASDAGRPDGNTSRPRPVQRPQHRRAAGPRTTAPPARCRRPRRVGVRVISPEQDGSGLFSSEGHDWFPYRVALRMRRRSAMPIVGAHALLYTPEAEAVRAILRDVFEFHHVDAGDGWLIFELPPAEVGVHPTGARPGDPADGETPSRAVVHVRRHRRDRRRPPRHGHHVPGRAD